MQVIMQFLTVQAQPIVQMPAAMPAPPAPPNVAYGVPKMYVNGLTTFSGLPQDWEPWEKATESTLGQTVYAQLLTTQPAPADLVLTTRNSELYNMFVGATHEGSAQHILQGANQDGFSAWTALKKWYGTDEVSRAIVEHYRTKLARLFLDEDTSAGEFINQYIICSQKLHLKGEGVTLTTKKEVFLDKITNDEYCHVKETCRGEVAITFEECVTRVRSREQVLEKESANAAKQSGKARRSPQEPERGADKPPEGGESHIPKSLLPSCTRSNPDGLDST
jgi:hypothetical protein